MNQHSKYLFKNLGILTVSNFASKVLVFLLVPLYTSVLSSEEYGIYDLVVSTVSLFLPLLTLNIIDAVMRFSMDKIYSKEEVAYIGIKYISFSIILVYFVFLVFHWFHLFPILNGLEFYVFLYYISCVLNQFFIQFAKGLERVKDMGIAGILGTAIMISANILFLLVFRTGLSGFFIANILAQAIPVLYYVIRLKFWRFIKGIQINKRLEKEMLVYCIPLICTTLGWWVNNAADRYIVTFMCGVAANGILSVSYKIPSIMNTLQNIFIQAWQISAVREYGETDASVFYGKTFLYLNVFMSITCSWLIILSKPLAHLLYVNDFYIAWKYVPFLLISSVINSSSGFIGPILSAKKDSKSMAISAIYGAIVNVVLNFGLIYLIGVQGATIATLISSFVIYFYRKQAVKNILRIESYWKILFIWVLLVGQAVLEIYFSVKNIEITIIAILIILNWKVLYKLIIIFMEIKRR